MVSAPIQNLSNLFKNKPSLVLFLICLSILAIATFYFAFKIEKMDYLVDIDKSHDYVEMMKHFNKLDLCINSSSLVQEKKNQKEEEHLTYKISIFTKISVKNPQVLQLYSQIYGGLILDEWYPTECQNLGKKPNFMEIIFSVPNEKTVVNNNSMDICIEIKGPIEYLPLFKESSCKVETSKNKDFTAKGFLSSKSMKEFDENFCSTGQILKANFNTTKPEIKNLLQDETRVQIHYSLMYCGWFLIIIVFLVLFCYMTKKPEYLEEKEHRARLL